MLLKKIPRNFTGALVMTTMIVSIVNLLIDIVYAFVDPRIKSQYTK